MNNKNTQELETAIAKSLTIGVILSAAVILTGFLMFLITGSSGYAQDSFPTNPLQILEGLTAFKPYAVILTGLLILILMPVVRVGVSIIVFIKEKDYKFTIITAIVFVILLISFLLGKAEQ